MTALHLVATLEILLIFWNQFFLLRLKHTQDSSARPRAYWVTMISEWVVTAVALEVVGFGALWYARLWPSKSPWKLGTYTIAAMAILSVAGMLLPLAMARKQAGQAALRRAVEKMRFLLPQSRYERLLWVALSVTAGFCEEVLFRAFLLQYLHAAWRLSLGLAILLACLMFGAGHLYQGVKGGVATAAVGFLLFLFYIGTGNLLLPVILHAFADSRVLLFLPWVEKKSAAIAQC